MLFIVKTIIINFDLQKFILKMLTQCQLIVVRAVVGVIGFSSCDLVCFYRVHDGRPDPRPHVDWWRPQGKKISQQQSQDDVRCWPT